MELHNKYTEVRITSICVKNYGVSALWFTGLGHRVVLCMVTKASKGTSLSI
jgi:hypothetical protein